MGMAFYAGTVGASVWWSEDRGETWDRPYVSGLYFECRVFSLTRQPADGSAVLAGTDQGVYRWRPGPRKWEHLPSILDSRTVWSITQSPHDPNLVLAGSTPGSLFRSEDGGESWRPASADIPAECQPVDLTRVTQIVFAPDEPNLAWATVEIAGVYRSENGGRSWTKRSEGLRTEDLHGLAVVLQGGRRKLLAVTNEGLHVSHDDGDSWTFQDVPEALRTEILPGQPWQYMRAVTPATDGSGAIFLTSGDGPPGSTGRLLRSQDFGETWTILPLPGDLNSTPWCVAVHPAEPGLVLLATAYGQLFRSEDGGDSWVRLRRELGEVRALLIAAT